jgi:CRISPR-associated endoribonuclease Cas6
LHIIITLQPKEKLELPISYNYYLQSMIYHAIDPELADFLHDQGFTVDNRVFKLFTFSRLFGEYEINKEKKTISFSGAIKLYISSPIEIFCQSIANGLLTKNLLNIGKDQVEVKQIMAKQYSVEDNKIVLRTLSPTTIYSTMLRPDGRKYTCFFQTGEPDFEQILSENLRKKYQACYGKEAPLGDIRVKILGQTKMELINYKGFAIKGYSGRLSLEGPNELLQMAVDAGIGSKNSQGLGCVEIVGGR